MTISPDKITITCPQCKAVFTRKKKHEEERPLRFCAYCRAALYEKSNNVTTQLTPLQPKISDIKRVIDQYQIISHIGKGGMGEVLLAFDTICGRNIALKKIRDDLVNHQQLQQRFLKEAEITSQLTHPAIIPIYAIHKSLEYTYYTMPYQEGETLKQILRKAKNECKHTYHLCMSKDTHTSIPALMRIFLQVCQAIAYAHSKGVLHRDIKPENIIVGTYGQVLILDWGLATLLQDTQEESLPETGVSKQKTITRVGKIVGTLVYMAPERILGAQATIQTDIYSLGVILYQILTLSLPFQRKSFKEFKNTWHLEQFVSPEQIAPYREVPQILSEVVKKCLDTDPKQRYNSVDELICSVENYLEGLSEWFLVKKLDICNKSDWLFQENILIPENTAITRIQEVSEWSSVMVAKDSFPDNTRIDAKVRIGSQGRGIGFLLSIPSPINTHHLTEGYLLWLSSDKEKEKKTKLIRSSVTVLMAPDVSIKQDEWTHIRIEKIDLHIYVFINNILQFSYISHIPIRGAHLGIIALDADFEMPQLHISVGSQNIHISCLAIPDAFLADHNFERALFEYRKIATLFPGRLEGREALFRGGIALLEQAKRSTEPHIQQQLYDQAHEEFQKLRTTPGAPLEYLGKALIYQCNNEYNEEIKCYELAVRKYAQHPHLLILEEQIAVRLHESARQNRYVAYQFILLVMQHLGHLLEIPSTRRLISSLEKHWEKPFFIEHQKTEDLDLNRLGYCLVLAFWLARPHTIQEIITALLQKPILPVREINDAIYILIELGAFQLAKTEMERVQTAVSDADVQKFEKSFSLFQIMLDMSAFSYDSVMEYIPSADTSFENTRCLLYLLRNTQKTSNTALYTLLSNHLLINRDASLQPYIDALLLETAVWKNNELIVKTVIERYEETHLSTEHSPLYFPYLCWLCKNSSKQIALNYFSQLLETAYPESHLLAAHILAHHIDIHDLQWNAKTFLYEKRIAYRHLSLFFMLSKDKEKAQTFYLLEQQQYCS